MMTPEQEQQERKAHDLWWKLQPENMPVTSWQGWLASAQHERLLNCNSRDWLDGYQTAKAEPDLMNAEAKLQRLRDHFPCELAKIILLPVPETDKDELALTNLIKAAMEKELRA